MYKPVDPKVSFPKMEEDIVRFWETGRIFQKSISQREGRTEFVFYDGPPFATGLPHFGHFVPGTIKDIIPRYKAMRGYKVERRFGWDCHGLPVENLIEKELGLDSKTDIETYGIAKFNEACRASVLRYVKEWRTIMTRAGRWVDFDNDYKTMDPDYMESIWWVIKRLWDSGLIYEGHYILPYCPRCATVLSNHELALGGYKDVHDPAITIKFKVVAAPARAPEGAGAPVGSDPLADGSTYFLAWTTTPWTLPSNLALCLGPDIDYVLVKDGDERYILAESRLGAYYKEGAMPEVLWRKKGSTLTGIEYEPLFPYFAQAREQNAFRTYTGEHVTTEDGTGIVHTAPGFGEEDHEVLKGTGVPTVCPIDAECKFTAEVSDYAGRFVKDCDKDIMDRLKAEGKLARREQILHAYPHCWRCDHPLIYRAVGSWFVKIDPVKPKMLAANAKIKWVPEHIKNGRFGKWLEGARDWAISRSRYWGNPLPIWRCPDCGSTACIGSRAELEKLSGVKLTDLHKHFVDEVSFKCGGSVEGKPCGGTMKRIPEVLDCWFESGSMPYAQVHYPQENKEHFESHFPANFISESLDQTRGWFYSLTVLAAALFDRPAFQNCIVSGMVLAADGKKMSKSQRNYTDPMEVIDKFGADALRLYLMSSPVLRADDLCFTDEGVKDVLKSVIIPLWNSYGFYVTYANIDKFPEDLPEVDVVGQGARNPLDRWILSLCEALVLEVGNALDDYDLPGAIAPILDFVDSLNNWYIRRNRRRFWRSGGDSSTGHGSVDEDKAQAYSVLRRVLVRLVMIASPFMPFVTEEIWRNLRRPGDPESVHLGDWPKYEASLRDEELERKMASVRHAVSMGRALRVQNDAKIRQPLAAVYLVTRDEAERAVLMEMEEILRDELNVKKVVFRANEEELVEYSAKANFRVLGKELGKDMKAAAEKIERFSAREIASLLEGAVLELEVAGRSVEITKDKVDVRRSEKEGLKVLNEGSLTLALDTEITDALLAEGYVRDLVRGVQNLRKEGGLEVTDRIKLSVAGDEGLKPALDAFMDFIRSETLALSVAWVEGQAIPGSGGAFSSIEAGDKTWRAAVAKA